MVFFGDSLLYDLFVICASSLVIVCALLVHLRNRWTRKGIPFANAHPLLGNLQDAVFRRKIMSDIIKDFYLEHRNKPYIGFFSLFHPIVMINDLELIKSVLVKDFGAFTDRNIMPSTDDPFQYHNMFSAKGQPWRELRSGLSPTFTSGKMKKMFELVSACGKDLVVCFEKERGESGDVLIKDLFARYTTDVIATCGFGIDGNALKDSNSFFRQILKKALTFDFWQKMILTLMFIFPSMISKFKVVLTPPDVEAYIRKTVWDTVEYRKKNKVTRNDFLDLLIQLKNKGSLDDDELLEDGEIVEKSSDKLDLEGDKFVAQCFIFLLAGFETSSSTMSNALYEMALDTEIQKRVYEEIKSVLSKHDGKVTYEAVQEMTYLHMVVQETLRKYPVLQFLDRMVTRPYRLPGTNIELERGESVIIPVIGLHHDPDLYPEPQRFDPERFNEDNRRTRPACSFLGFGEGPRICIGMRMGWMQVKVGLIYTLLNYEFSPNKNTKIPLEFENVAPLTQVKGDIPLRMKKRSV